MQFVAKTRYSYISCGSCGNARLPTARIAAVAPPASSHDASSGNQHQHSARAAPAIATAVAAVAAVPSNPAASGEEGATIFAGEAMCPVHVQLVYRYTPTGTGEGLSKVRASDRHIMQLEWPGPSATTLVIPTPLLLLLDQQCCAVHGSALQ
jgi:hypothetical protein